jgi:hypothetical protein
MNPASSAHQVEEVHLFVSAAHLPVANALLLKSVYLGSIPAVSLPIYYVSHEAGATGTRPKRRCR